MADKVFKTHDELIELLITRGIDISTPTLRSFAKKRLQHEGYYNLINGYNSLFLIRPDVYKTGTTINEIYALYDFDKNIRNLFLKYILQIETNVKSLIAYYFPMEYSHDNYLLYKNFDTSKTDSRKNITSLISEIQRQTSSHYSDPSISHYLTNYGYIPLWVINNVLTLGTVSKFFSLMKQQQRQSVAKTFHIMDNELESFLFYLSKIRNFCAHGNRLYCFNNKTPIKDTSVHSFLNINKNNKNEYVCGKRDLFACVIVLSILLANGDFKKFLNSFNEYYNKLKSEFIVLNEGSILHAMGFPENWTYLLSTKNISKIKKMYQK